MKKRILCLFLGFTMMFSQVMTVSASSRKEELEQEKLNVWKDEKVSV